MQKNNSIYLLIPFIVGLISILFLAAGLSRLGLRPGTLFDQSTLGELKAILQNRDAILNLVLVILIILPVLLILVSNRSIPKRPAGTSPGNGLLAQLVRIAFWVVALMILRQSLRDRQLSTNLLTSNPTMKLLEVTPAQVSPSAISDGLAFLLSFALILAIIIPIWLILRRRKESVEAIEFIQQEAQTALREIKSGVDPHNVILRCYYEMNEVLNERKGIQRKDGMTPREFEGRLIELGLPKDPVTQLTRLFEQVRYGAKNPGQDFEIQAIACLSAIIEGSGGIL